MKKAVLFVAFLAMTGCQKSSDNIWESNQTGAGYSHKNSASLWGNSSSDQDTAFSGPSQEEFLPLKEEDLKAQFADGAIPQPSFTPGEAGSGLPGIHEFQDPNSALASVFRPVFFNTDDHILRGKEYLESINHMAAYLKKHPGTYVVIEGYCDERGAEAYNLALGARRANYVRSLLVKQGVDANQLHTISFGKEKPFVQGHGPDSWAQNRRAHFKVHQK